MNGLRFYPDALEVDSNGGTPIFVHGALDDARSNFDFIFRCIYPHVVPLVFAQERSECILSCDELILVDYEGTLLSTLPRWHIMPGSSIRRFGIHVDDDWNMIVLFNSLTDHAEIGNFTNRMLQHQHSDFPSHPGAEMCLHSWDGVYWEIFAKDAIVYDELRLTHRDNSHLDMYWVNYAVDFPHPRDAQLQSA